MTIEEMVNIVCITFVSKLCIIAEAQSWFHTKQMPQRK